LGVKIGARNAEVRLVFLLPTLPRKYPPIPKATEPLVVMNSRLIAYFKRRAPCIWEWTAVYVSIGYYRRPVIAIHCAQDRATGGVFCITKI
jgi:hypothetical protein